MCLLGNGITFFVYKFVTNALLGVNGLIITTL